MKEITELQLAWCAGVVDVLGLISVRKMKTGSELASVAISSTRIDLLQEIAELTGTTIVTVHRDYNRLNCNLHCPEKHSHVTSTTGRWSLTGARAAVFLNAIEPYLRLKQGNVRQVVDVGITAPHKPATLRKMYNLGWPKLEVV